jgi:gamma-glutamyltranspeptidase/glutathione hydrolase
MYFDPLYYPYFSQRMTVYSNQGMVATSQPLAAQAGLEILKKGGNAIDAAIATASCLTVVEPTSNGIGGDAFALVWSGGKLYGLNASGPAPQLLSGSELREKGLQEMPMLGWETVTVPGAPAAWAALAERFGSIPLTVTMQPAISYAEQGYPVSPVVSACWQEACEYYSQVRDSEQYHSWFSTFTIDGRAPRIGEIWKSPAQARTLQEIAETNSKSFYQGALAEKIDDFARKYNGYLRQEDLEAFQPEWVEPISINYRGYDVWEIPPNGHGLVALMALNILKGFEFQAKDTLDTYHKQIEAIKLAYADGLRYIAEPSAMPVKVKDLLSEAYAEERRKLISAKAIQPLPGTPPQGGTVYIATADSYGNMVSMIQSNYNGFGSGLVVPDTGISLHNRGSNFSLNPESPNFLLPGKRPYHTIIPGFLTKDNHVVGPFGVMGGFMQPQGHVQVIMNTIDFGLNPQAALDAPRWLWVKDKIVKLEQKFPEHIAQGLHRLGHDIELSLDTSLFGRGQIIWRDQQGILAGGTEPRADGMVAAW